MKYIQKIFLFITVFMASMFFVMEMPKAATCNSDLIWNYEQGNFSGITKDSIKCECDASKDNYASCQKMTSLTVDSNGAIQTTQIGSTFSLYATDTRNTAVYAKGMSELVTTIKAILNLVIGVTLFLLGGGFLWNMTQMGLHASNAQKRQEALGRLGEIFATALFIGLIPLIVQFIVGIMSGL